VIWAFDKANAGGADHLKVETINVKHCAPHRRFAGVALVVLMAGCAGALARSSDPRGTWHGTLGEVGAHQYEVEALITLQIADDGTFAATVTPNRGANNLAKASRWSGTVVASGNRVTLRNSEGPWPWVTLARSRDGNVLYGVASDPGSLSHVMLRFDREGSQQTP